MRRSHGAGTRLYPGSEWQQAHAAPEGFSSRRRRCHVLRAQCRPPPVDFRSSVNCAFQHLLALRAPCAASPRREDAGSSVMQLPAPAEGGQSPMPSMVARETALQHSQRCGRGCGEREAIRSARCTASRPLNRLITLARHAPRRWRARPMSRLTRRPSPRWRSAGARGGAGGVPVYAPAHPL